MIKIQHAKIGNTWWLQHDESQANPWSDSYAGNVSILDSTWCQKCKDTKLWWLSFLGASQCVKSLPWMTEPTKWWALSNLWDLILSWRLIWVDVSIHYQVNPPMETVNLGSLSLCSCFPPLPVALFNGSCQGFIIKRWTPFFRILCMLEWRSELAAHGGAKASKLAGRWN